MEIDFTPWDKEYDEARKNLEPQLEGLSTEERAKKIAAFEKIAEKRRQAFVWHATTTALGEELAAVARRYDRVLELSVFRSAGSRAIFFNKEELGPQHLHGVVRAGLAQEIVKSVERMEKQEQEQDDDD